MVAIMGHFNVHDKYIITICKELDDLEPEEAAAVNHLFDMCKGGTAYSSELDQLWSNTQMLHENCNTVQTVSIPGVFPQKHLKSTPYTLRAGTMPQFMSFER